MCDRDIGLKNGTIGTENTAFDNDELTTTHMGDSRVEGDHVRRQEHDRRQEHHRRQEHNRRQEHHRRQEHDRRQEATANVHMPTYGVHRRTSSKGNADHQVVAATMSRPYEKNREYARVGHQALKIGKQKQEMKARHQPNVCQETKRLCENKQILREDKVNKLLDQSRLVHGERMYAQNHTSGKYFPRVCNVIISVLIFSKIACLKKVHELSISSTNSTYNRFIKRFRMI